MTPLLAIDDLHVHYNGMIALRGISLEVNMNEIVCIIGPNGAGKSTTLAAIAGGVKATKGFIHLAGTNTAVFGPEKLADMGVSLVPEGRHIFSSLSVNENLMIGSHRRTDKKAVRADRDRLLGLFPRLVERLNYPAGRLSGGEQQMLTTARTILGRPSVLLLDEPLEGLAPVICEELMAAFSELAGSGDMTILLVEQRIQSALDFADEVIVLERGRIAWSGTPSALSQDQDAVERLLGVGGLH